MNRDKASELAVEALVWLASEPETLGGFLGASGLVPADLRARMGDPEFLSFVLDFLLSDEALLLRFCAEGGRPPGDPARARAALPGGDIPNWT